MQFKDAFRLVSTKTLLRGDPAVKVAGSANQAPLRAAVRSMASQGKAGKMGVILLIVSCRDVIVPGKATSRTSNELMLRGLVATWSGLLGSSWSVLLVASGRLRRWAMEAAHHLQGMLVDRVVDLALEPFDQAEAERMRDSVKAGDTRLLAKPT